ncbi:lytic transglycosylase domain-containing protein [Flavobacterium microcysteis]|uniref:Lytic transglycosylase domain-containing protein n=1 Tax=Flavobacterium microcysteis TaxID=2596891 RepID=A0A501QM81_9FLAO|nr:lytic transglycosylase domain-containing protein [Flavobacterium microcysteis]TPD73341.1 lytic transglycosylase domain-containing protein [Flavobacterium microcysteis]
MKLMKKTGLIASVVLVSGILIHAVSDEKIGDKAPVTKGYFFPAEIDFAGEKTPLNIIDVKERLDRELLVNANLDASTLLIIKRANRFFPVIEPILKKNGVPDDFKYLAVAESALMNATSSAGAKGFWQFMADTAKERGMEVNDGVDERYHLEKSTEAACKYLLDAYKKFGSWTLAAASYNGGFGGVNKQITIQGVTNYYDLLLTDETARYVFRILALKQIMKNPVQYGFDIAPAELYQAIPTRKLEIDSSITDLASFAKSQGINYKILKIHNPWLRDRKLANPTKKKYVIEIPTAGY